MDWSPLNTNVCEPDELELVLLELLPEDARNSVHGTGTCLPPVEAVEVPVGLDGEDAELAEEAEELEDAPPEVIETSAKSILPEFGFTMTSLMVPMVLPCELVTDAPIRSLPLTCCPVAPVRPVGLKLLLSDEDPLERLPDEEEPPCELEDDPP